jgi:hypothetical protein
VLSNGEDVLIDVLFNQINNSDSLSAPFVRVSYATGLEAFRGTTNKRHNTWGTTC